MLLRLAFCYFWLWFCSALFSCFSLLLLLAFLASLLLLLQSVLLPLASNSSFSGCFRSKQPDVPVISVCCRRSDDVRRQAKGLRPPGSCWAPNQSASRTRVDVTGRRQTLRLATEQPASPPRLDSVKAPLGGRGPSSVVWGRAQKRDPDLHDSLQVLQVDLQVLQVDLKVFPDQQGSKVPPEFWVFPGPQLRVHRTSRPRTHRSSWS